MLHYKTRDKKFKRAEFHKEISYKYRFVIYKIKIGHYYYIGITRNFRERMAMHRICIRKSALAISSGANTEKIQTPYFVFGNILARNIKNLEKSLYNMRVEILHGVRKNDYEYAYRIESELIKKNINDWRCLNIKINDRKSSTWP